MGRSSGVITPAVSGSLRPGLGCHDAVDHSSQQYRQLRRGNLGEDVTPKVQYTHDGSEGARHANAVLLSDPLIGEGDTQPVLEIAVCPSTAISRTGCVSPSPIRGSLKRTAFAWRAPSEPSWVYWTLGVTSSPRFPRRSWRYCCEEWSTASWQPNPGRSDPPTAGVITPEDRPLCDQDPMAACGQVRRHSACRR